MQQEDRSSEEEPFIVTQIRIEKEFGIGGQRDLRDCARSCHLQKEKSELLAEM